MEEALTNFFQKHLQGFEKILKVERLSSGASQETYRVVVAAGGEKHFAFRRAPKNAGEFSKISLNQEAALIQLAQKYKVPEPNIIAVCEKADGLGQGFMMEWLEGETLGKKILQAEQLKEARKKLAYQCGEILATIHLIAREEVEPLNLPRQTPEQVLTESYQVYQGFAVPRPMIDYTARWLKENMPHGAHFCLTHNDFRNGNLMVAPSGIIAVLDWELACISDPMRDLGWLCANCWRFGGAPPVGGFGSYEDLFAGYRAGGAAELLDQSRVKFWQVMSSFRWAIMCLGMAQRWRLGAEPSLERAAIGRRTSESEIDCANLLLNKKAQPLELNKKEDNHTMPTKEELLGAVRDYLLSTRTGTGTQTTRDRFLALVGANSLDIVLRELQMGEKDKSLEREDLQNILGSTINKMGNKTGDIETLRAALIEKIKTEQIALDDERLKDYLRGLTLRQVQIDQPNYSGLKHAIG